MMLKNRIAAMFMCVCLGLTGSVSVTAAEFSSGEGVEVFTGGPKENGNRQLTEEERMEKRQELVDFAVQFEGNPYVYGGTSLTNGADCSGFVMSVFKEFGYDLPRVAAAQYDASTKKDLSELEVGDLLFYGGYGISHVAIYIGNEQIVHASTSASGIKISNYNYEAPVGVGTYLK